MGSLLLLSPFSSPHSVLSTQTILQNPSSSCTDSSSHQPHGWASLSPPLITSVLTSDMETSSVPPPNTVTSSSTTSTSSSNSDPSHEQDENCQTVQSVRLTSHHQH